jgi:hypothetical protein
MLTGVVPTLVGDEHIVRYTLIDGEHEYHVKLNRASYEGLAAQLCNADRTFRQKPTLRFYVSGNELDINISDFDMITIERRPGHTGADIPANARTIGEEMVAQNSKSYILVPIML